MLKVHPTSHAAYLLKAQVAEAEERGSEAMQLYDRALAQVVSGADGLYLKWARPTEVIDLIEHLRLRVKGQ